MSRGEPWACPHDRATASESLARRRLDDRDVRQFPGGARPRSVPAPIADDLDTSVALVGQVPALVMILAALLGLVIGPLADHYGCARTLMVGMVAATMQHARATGLTPTYAFLLAGGRWPARSGGPPSAGGPGHRRRSRFHGKAGPPPRHEPRRRWATRGRPSSASRFMTLIAAYGGWRVAFLILAVLGFLSLRSSRAPSRPTSRPGSRRLHPVREVLASYVVPPASTARHFSLIVATLIGNIGGLGRLELSGGVPRGGPRLLAPGRRSGSTSSAASGVMVGTMISGHPPRRPSAPDHDLRRSALGRSCSPARWCRRCPVWPWRRFIALAMVLHGALRRPEPDGPECSSTGRPAPRR